MDPQGEKTKMENGGHIFDNPVRTYFRQSSEDNPVRNPDCPHQIVLAGLSSPDCPVGPGPGEDNPVRTIQ